MTGTEIDVRTALVNGGADVSSREKLLRAAETLFAARGFQEVSVREIAAHAGVNSALVGYYFRGKQALFNEVYRSNAAPLAQERMQRLKEITRRSRTPSVEEILEAWLIPWLRTDTGHGDSALHLRFTANLSRERWEQSQKAAPFMQRTHNAFIKALQSCLPHLSRATINWRLHFVVGAVVFGIRTPDALRAFSKGECDPEDLSATLDQILQFAVAGFCAPEPGKTEESPA